MSRIKYGCLVLLAFISMPAFPVTLEELVGTEQAARLVRDGTVSEVQQKNPRPLLLPTDDAVRRLVANAAEELVPGIMMENLSLYQKPADASSSWSEAEHTALYNSMVSLSTLKGIEYFSISRNRMRVLYETSEVVDGPDTKNPRPDPHYNEPPAELALYARQTDTTFGDNIYRYTFYAQPGSLVFVQQNLTDMSYGIIRMVGKDKLRSAAAVYDAGPYLLIYTVSMVKAVSMPGMGRRVGDSFSNRAMAILGWFSGHADRVFGKEPL